MRTLGIGKFQTSQVATYLGDVPCDGRVIEVFVDIIHDTSWHVLEELGHALAPATGRAPGPGGVVEHLAAADHLKKWAGSAHLLILLSQSQNLQDSSFALQVALSLPIQSVRDCHSVPATLDM